MSELLDAAGSDSGGGASGQPMRPKRDRTGAALAAAAIALGVFLYVGRLGMLPLQVGNEAMYVAPPIFMLQSGDYLVPRFQGAAFLDKPPLTFWLIAASYRVLGVSLAAGRLPGVLASLATVLAAALWVRRRRGEHAAWIAAVALLFLYGFWTFSRYFAADALFTLAITFAVIGLDAACRRPSGSDAVRGGLAGAALAFAFLAKGLAGLVLPTGAVAAGLALDRVRPIRPWRRGAIAALVLVALLAPWHVAMSLRMGTLFWRTFYWDNQFLRGATSQFMRMARGPLFYLPVVAWAAFPWSALLPVSFRVPKGSRAALGWFLFGLLFWSALVMKREVYLMPVFPAIAILAAERLDREQTEELPRSRWVWVLVAAVVAVALVLLGAVRGILTPLVGAATWTLLAAAGVVVLGVVAAAVRSRSLLRSAAAIGLGCGLCFLALDRMDHALARFDPFPSWGERVRAECADGCDQYLVDVNATGIEFYSQSGWISIANPAVILTRSSHRKGFLLLARSGERALASLPIRFDVIERREWLPGAWFAWALRNRRSPLQTLSLVRFERIGPEAGF